MVIMLDLTAVFESEANQTRVWVVIYASDLHIRNQTKSGVNQNDHAGEARCVCLLAIQR